MIKEANMPGLLKKIFFTLASLFVTLIPTLIYVSVRFLLEPEGFWQNFILLGIGVWILGGMQVLLLILWFMFFFSVILGLFSLTLILDL